MNLALTSLTQQPENPQKIQDYQVLYYRKLGEGTTLTHIQGRH